MPTEHISLPLAKRIAEGYKLLGVEAPISRYAYDSNGEVRFADTLATIYFDYRAYTAAELFDALPVGTIVRKCEINEKLSWYQIALPQKYKAPVFFHDILCEGLGMVLERVLDEMRREKGK